MPRPRFIAIFAVLPILILISSQAAATTRCRLIYDLDGWSAIYKTGRGGGVITCDDGQSANVRIITHGAGFTGGTQHVKGGKGVFSMTEKVDDLFRTYIEGTGHAGVGADKFVEARAMFAGSKRLSLSGKGSGISLGMSVGGFTIRGK